MTWCAKVTESQRDWPNGSVEVDGCDARLMRRRQEGAKPKACEDARARLADNNQFAIGVDDDRPSFKRVQDSANVGGKWHDVKHSGTRVRLTGLLGGWKNLRESANGWMAKSRRQNAASCTSGKGDLTIGEHGPDGDAAAAGSNQKRARLGGIPSSPNIRGGGIDGCRSHKEVADATIWRQDGDRLTTPNDWNSCAANPSR